jgi:hypothetical protein
MMNKEALDRILEIHDAAREVRSIEGIKYTTGNLRAILPSPPEPIEMESLTGLVDFVGKNREQFPQEEMAILVKSQSAVRLCGKMSEWGPEAKSFRPQYANIIRNKDIEEFAFGDFMDHETFIIKLMTQFVWDDGLTAFIARVRTIKSGSSIETEDNGTVNKVTKKEGIELNMDREIIKLRPFRTFSEVEQPQTPFIFRATLRGGEVQCALLECDGGAWLNQARLNIKAYLEKALPDIPVFA